MNKIVVIINLLVKKPVHAVFSAFSEEFKSSHKAPKFKISDRVKITNHKKEIT